MLIAVIPTGPMVFPTKTQSARPPAAMPRQENILGRKKL